VPQAGSHKKEKKGSGPQGYVLRLVPEPADAIRELRWALKGLLRRHHLRCVDLREAHAEKDTPIPSLKEAS
jgi:hypothetical protein